MYVVRRSIDESHLEEVNQASGIGPISKSFARRFIKEHVSVSTLGTASVEFEGRKSVDIRFWNREDEPSSFQFYTKDFQISRATVAE